MSNARFVYKAVSPPEQNIMAGQNPGLKLVVLQPARERRSGCLQQGIGINAAPGAPQACREVTDSLETLKSLTESSAGMMWEKYAEQKPCSLQPRSKIKVKADGAGGKVPAAVKKPCSSSDLSFALGSFKELPHLMACQDSRKGGKGKLGKEEETGESLGGKQSPSQIWWRCQIRGGISSIPQLVGKQHLERSSSVSGRLWAKILCALNFTGETEYDDKSHHATCEKT